MAFSLIAALSATAIRKEACLMKQQHEEYVEANRVEGSEVWAVKALSFK